VTLDALAFEPHFLDHIAPVWRALPQGARGRLLVDRDLQLDARAEARGIEAEAVSGSQIRMSSPPPKARAGDGPLALVASIGDMKIARRLGYRRFVFIEHGMAQSYSGTGRSPIEASYSGGPDREDVVLFLVPNKHAAGRWRATYPQTPVEVVGCPKLETLPARDAGPAPVVCISFHWNTPLVGLPPEAGNALGEFRPILPDLAVRFPDLIGHAHPRHAKEMARIYRLAGIPFVEDFEEVCRRADVYVCDNSSTIFEFASTGRPVVLMNAKQYRRHVHHGLRFWEAASVGVQVDDKADLASCIDRALSDPPEQQAAREAALSVVYAYRGNAANRAAAAILEHIGEAVAA